MLRASLALVLLTLTSIASAAPPVAHIDAAATASVKQPMIIDFAGTVSEAKPVVKVLLSPAGASTRLVPLYTEAQQLACALFIPDQPGAYRFAILAIGSTDDSKPLYDFAIADTVVGGLPPPTPPGPGPTPPPGPGPTPPTPPVTTKIFAVGVYSADPSNPAEVAFVPVRDSLTIDGKLKALNASWKAWNVSDPSLDALHIRPHLVGVALPVLFLYDSTGKVLVTQTVPATVTEDYVVSLVKQLRPTWR